MGDEAPLQGNRRGEAAGNRRPGRAGLTTEDRVRRAPPAEAYAPPGAAAARLVRFRGLAADRTTIDGPGGPASPPSNRVGQTLNGLRTLPAGSLEKPPLSTWRSHATANFGEV